MNTEIAFSTMTELASGLATGKWSSVELTQAFLQRIHQTNDKLHAYVQVDDDFALSMARAADDRRANGVLLSVLDGVPLAVKDLCELKGHVTTAGSQLWVERKSKTSSTALLKLLRSGMVLLGKTHMVEFAFGGWGTNPVMGAPWNPWDLATHRVPGGSSSGSGVAVAAGLAPVAIGSDTGGSIRVPSALNGLTGLKTTRGLISLYGSIALSNTLDTIGPMARSAEDAAILTSLMAGPDPLDSSSLNRPGFVWRPCEPTSKPLTGIKLAVTPVSQYPMKVSDDAMRTFDDACRTLVSLGATLSELSLPFDFHDLMQRNGQIIAAEAYSEHHAYIEDESLPIGSAVRQRVQSGRAVSAADYIDAIAHHRASSARWAELMSDCAALVTPAVPFAAIPIDEVDESMTPLVSFARAGNYLTTCAMTLPAGLSTEGLPLGVQLLGKAFDEASLLKVGVAFQRETDWHRARPDLGELGV